MTARVLPYNLSAEESLLGAMTLNSDAISVGLEKLKAEDFYSPAHGHLFKAIQDLYNRGEPVDTVSIWNELQNTGLGELIGGVGKLVSIQNATPSTANAEKYANIVHENALARRIIQAGTEIAEAGFDAPGDLSSVLNRAETLIYGLSDASDTSETKPAAEIAQPALASLRRAYEIGKAVTGVESGFEELDAMLAGWQPSAFYVIGARPSMGKTAFALNVAAHSAIRTNTPTLIFSLEMGEQELYKRMLSSEGEVSNSSLKDGKLYDHDWINLAQAANLINRSPLSINDRAQMTISEIRSEARRVKASSGLGLIIIDYIQLMTGSQNGNRQEEVSEISRGLKILAKELEVPVIGLSQLSRSLEARMDKRPMLSDLRESGCMPADTRILRADGTETTLGKLVDGERPEVWSLDGDGRIVKSRVVNAFPSGRKPVYEVTTTSGLKFKATGNHKFKKVNGWAALDDLVVGDRIAVPLSIPCGTSSDLTDDELILTAHMIGDGTIGPNGYKYASVDLENVRVVAEAARNLFGIEMKSPVYANTHQCWFPAPYRLARGRCHPMKSFFANLGLLGSRSHNKFVPDAVKRGDSKQTALFLRHLWATDGSLGGEKMSGSIYYGTTSRLLAEDVRTLLLKLDISSRLYEIPNSDGHRTMHHVVVSGHADRIKFLLDVGCHGDRGKLVQPLLERLNSTKPNPNVGSIPAEVGIRVKAEMVEVGLSRRALAGKLGEDYCGSYFLGRNFTRGRLDKIADILGSDGLKAISNSDVMWDEIRQIEPLGMEDVYDATVEGTHNFVANGVVAHNSLEQDADVVFFLYRDEVYNDQSEWKGTAEVIVAKHRNGRSGTVRLGYAGEWTKFLDLA